MKVDVCKCCGHPIPPYGVRGALTGLQRRIFDTVARSGQHGVPVSRIMDAVYASDIGGGPDSSNIIAVVRKQMEPTLTRFGYAIKVRRGPGAVWRVEKI